jgi:hypothetical protein
MNDRAASRTAPRGSAPKGMCGKLRGIPHPAKAGSHRKKTPDTRRKGDQTMNKKRILSLTAISLLALMLAGCGTGKTVSTSASTNTDRLNTSYTDALTVESQLVLGTLKLEGTSQAVDSATAAQILPLYSLLEQMTTSGTSAQAEIDAVLDQIQGTMTTDQIHAIAAMKLTQADLQSYLGQNGGSAPASSGTPAGGGFPSDGGGDAGGPPAGFTDGGGGAAGGAGSTESNLNQNQIATLQAQKTGTPGFSGTPALLINQLIQLLQKKTQTSTLTQ